VDRGVVEVQQRPVCDVLRFRDALAGDPTAAAAFEVPRMFSGLLVHHAPAFEEWAEVMRARSLRQYLDLLAGQAREAMYQWRWRDAAEWGERWLTHDSLSDD